LSFWQLSESLFCWELDMLVEVLNVSPLPVILVGGIFVVIGFVFVYTFQLLVKAVAYRCMTRIE